MKEYDVVIIGAGPAGLYCGNMLSSSLRAAIITNKEIASHKPCGGLLTEQAKKYLEALDNADSFRSVISEVDSYIYCDGHWTKEKFYNVNRETMEMKLFESIKNLIDLYITRKFSINRINGIFHIESKDWEERIVCKYLVIADGVNSRTRRMLGYKKPPIIKLEQQICDNETDCVKMVFDKNISKEYYYWIIPKNDTMLVGYKVEDKENVIKDIKSRFNIDLLSKKAAIERYPVTKIREIKDVELGSENAFLIGEAAGLVYPRGGEGLTSAFQSAKNLAGILPDSSVKDKNNQYYESMRIRIQLLNIDLQQQYR